MTKDEALKLALEALEDIFGKNKVDVTVINVIKEAMAQPEQPVLQDIEQYRLQMAGISTAAFGYWKKGNGIHPDYDTMALRDVAELYQKYDVLYKAQSEMQDWEAVAADQAMTIAMMKLEQEPVALNRGYAERLIEALEDNSDPVSIDAAEEFRRLLTSPPQRQPLNETQIEDCIDSANRRFNGRRRGPSGQQVTTYDDWKHWLAREIEKAHDIGDKT